MTHSFNCIRFFLGTLGLLFSLAVTVQARFDSEEIPTLSTHLTGFEIPFSIQNESGKYIEVQLFVSQDFGRTWNYHQSKPLTTNKFSFTGKTEGEYWFAMKTLDRNRQLIPSGNIVRPEIKIIVDTTPPKLEFRTSSDQSGRAVADWKAEDANLDLATVKIMYRPQDQDDQNWQTVNFKPTKSLVGGIYVDRIAWWPETTAQNLDIRFQVADKAGNSVFKSGSVALVSNSFPRQNNSSTTWRKRERQNYGTCANGVCNVPPANQDLSSSRMNAGRWFRSTLGPTNSERFTTNSKPQPSAHPESALANQSLTTHQPADPDSIRWESKVNKWVKKAETNSSSTLASKHQTVSDRSQKLALKHPYENVPIKNQPEHNARLESEKRSSRPPNEMFVTESTTMRRGLSQIPVVVNRANPNQLPNTNQQRWNEVGKQEAFSIQDDHPDYVAPPNPGMRLPIRPASSPKNPATAIHRAKRSNSTRLKANSPRFNLNYDVRAIDPSGIGKVILWGTQDGGRTWKSLAVDPDNKSPFPVQVQTEGTYGYKVVINSRDGLAGKPPASGDQPDVWVEVDWTVPQVQINSAPFGSGKDVGKLIIHFSASDQNLAIRPIRLYYSSAAQGPWTTIEEGLRNSGSYAWKVPSHVPENIFLRIEARDTANNFGAYQLTSPINISGLIPRGRIFGLEPVAN